MLTEETESGGSILRNNDRRDYGWYRSENVLAHKWTRIVGPQAIAIYHLFKSMCKGGEETTYPEVRQQDWAALLGMGLQPFQRSLKQLIDASLVDRILPQGRDKLLHKPTIYIVNAAEDVPITPELLKKFEIKAEEFPSDCRFNDPLLASDQWNINMFRTTAKAPTTKRRIRDRLNNKSRANTSRDIKFNTSRDIKFNMSEDISDNTCILNRQCNKQTEEPLSKDNGNGSDEPCTSLNNSSSWDTYNIPIEEIKNDFILISIPQKEQLPITAKAEQGSNRAEEVKTSPETSLTDRIRKNLPRTNGASRQAKSEQLPPREAMPQCLQIWFTLPFVTKPTVKTYHRIIRLIHQLEQGKFPSQYKSLNIDFVEQQKIKSEHLTKKWGDKELSHLLDKSFRLMIEDASYKPENKERYFKGLSFESFVLNKRTGRSWLLGLLQPPQLLRSINTKQTIEHDPYPRRTYEIAEALEISQKTNPEEYAGIARNFSKIVRFFQLLPVEEGHERDGILKFVNQPQTLANSLVGFFEEQYSWVVSKGAHAGLLSLKGKPFRKWLEWGEWGEQQIRLPGRKKPSYLLKLLDEYNQYGELRMTAVESMQAAAAQEERSIPEEEAAPKPTAVEVRQREEEATKHLAPDDIIPIDAEKPKKGSMLRKLKAALVRLKQGIPDPIVDESYAGF